LIARGVGLPELHAVSLVRSTGIQFNPPTAGYNSIISHSAAENGTEMNTATTQARAGSIRIVRSLRFTTSEIGAKRMS
jgi:hypothetical protein